MHQALLGLTYCKTIRGFSYRNSLNFTEFKLILSDFLNINLPEKYRDWWQEFSSSNAGTMNLQKLQEFFHAFVSCRCVLPISTAHSTVRTAV